MRAALAVLLASLLLAPVISSSASHAGVQWEDARVSQGTHGGTIGGISISLSENSTESSVSSDVSELPTVIEVYTATWCPNCPDTEGYMEDAIGTSDVELIHYHRHWLEMSDPFGSNSTEERWESQYGHAVTLAGGAPRLAPTSIIDGERIHYGTRAKTGSMVEDYSLSISEGSSAPVMGQISLMASFSQEQGIEIAWNISGMMYSCADDCPSFEVNPWILFVEDSAYFPDGSNGLEYYLHVLHEAIEVEGEEGTLSMTPPPAWDDDDMSVVLVVDWEQESPDKGSPLPAPGIITLLCFLAALVPRQTDQ